MAKRRGRIIDEDMIEAIVYILDNWKGKLTWDALIVAVKASLTAEYTRQALANHERICLAFSVRKKGLAQEKGSPPSKDARVNDLEATISSLKTENKRLKAECDAYRAQFIRWVANVQKKNMTFEQLDAPLGAIHRAKKMRPDG